MTDDTSPGATGRDRVEPVSDDALPTPAPRAEWAYKLRRMRDRVLGTELFGEPAWDALLYLAAARDRRECTTVGALTVELRLPEDAVRRLLANLAQNGLVECIAARESDPAHRLTLTPEGAAKLAMVLG
jgi:hypothetical protein